MGRGKNERPTENDWNSFRSKSSEEKIQALCRFLLGTNENMGVIGRGMFGDNGGFTVSMIHRCYNINTQFYRHQGKYAPSSKFCREYGEVYQEDIEAFVYTYKDGITYTQQVGTGIELEEFLKERIKQRQSYAYDDNDYDEYDEDDSDYEENDFYNNVGYQNSRNNRRKNRNTFSISQYTNRQNDNSYNTGNSYTSRNLDDINAEAIGLGLLGLAVIFVVLALIFNWFHWRSKLLGFISDWIWVAWFVGMLIFLIKIIIGKVEFMNYKKFSTKVILFLVIGAASFLISTCIGGLFYYLSLK